MSSTTKAGKPEHSTEQLLPDEVIRHIPLSDIFVDYSWNVRSLRNVMSEVSDAVQDTTLKGTHTGEGAGIVGLAVSLLNDGQDQAVFVRKVEGGKSLGGKKTDKPFEVYCGFRRITAADILNRKPEEIAKTLPEKAATDLVARIETATKAKRNIIPNTANGTILAVIRNVDAAKARLDNGRENTLRQNLDTPDMVKYISNLTSETKMTQAQMAEALGIGQPYVSRLKKVATLPSVILNHWRGEGKVPGLPETVTDRLTSRQLSDLADLAMKDSLPEGEVIKRYVDTLNPPTAADGSGGEDADRPLKRIKELGFMIGVMIREGILVAGDLSWARVIGPKREGFLIDTGKVDATKRGEYWNAMAEAVDLGLTPPKKEKAPKTQQEKDEAAAN